MKSILLCDNGDLLNVLPLSEEYGLGIEMQAFYDPSLYEANSSLVEMHLSHIGNVSLRAVHGCFADLCPGSFDSLVRSTAKNRFELSYSAAMQLNATHLILHHGYVPHTSPASQWLARCSAFWKEFMIGKNNLVSIHIENLLEWEPNLISDLLDSIDNPAVDANLDIGHAYCNSKMTVIEWIQILAHRIGYVHLHDNNGKEDEHLAFGKGTIPLNEVLAGLEYYSPEACWAIESHGKEIEQSIIWLLENGMVI
jgi:sugar phosphate isomerase/epimerase